MKVLIIEDEAPAFRRLQKILEEISLDIEIIEVIDSVRESINWLLENDQPDLIFMDIQLSDGLSFDIFEGVTISKPVIFTTAFDEYMLKAFKVNSIDYLLKPIKKEDMEHSLQKYQLLKSSFSTNEPTLDINQLVRQIKLNERKFKTRFLVKVHDKLVSVETSTIAYFQMRHGVVHLVTAENKKYLMDITLDELNAQLDPQQFTRANRQYIVHFPAVGTVHRYHKGKLLLDLVPAPEDQVVVSAEKASSFRQWLGDGEF
ncbi:MAG: response regulator transcription factor [Cyclobacteriaceae bacterium]|nr:response regulator transcription factor [Cyclobacteriaceae bacterium HetDA_MAG_MS6]